MCRISVHVFVNLGLSRFGVSERAVCDTDKGTLGSTIPSVKQKFAVNQ